MSMSVFVHARRKYFQWASISAGSSARVADVHHHLGHVDGPALGEDAGAEDGARQRVASVRPGQLEVVTRDGLVDGEDPERAAVVLAQHRLDLALGPDSGGGVMAKKLSSPLSSGPGGMSIAPPKARRNGGVQMIWSGSSGRPIRSRSRTNARMRSCSARQKSSSSSAFGWSTPDGVENATGELVRVVRHRLVAHPGRPLLTGEAQHLGADLVVGGRGALLELLGCDGGLQGVVRTCARRARDRAGRRPSRSAGGRPAART